jgi:hypothetical protein
MRINVGHRSVLPPWAERSNAGRAATVRREGNVVPDAGPLSLYQSVFPERYVAWDASRQLFEIRQKNPFTGFDERVELIFDWVVPPDAEGNFPTEEEMAAMIQNRSPRLRRQFKPFDYAFVRKRLAERYEFLRLGSERYTDAIANRNRARQRQRMGAIAREMAAGIKDIKRWLPALASGYADERVPLVAGGLTR